MKIIKDGVLEFWDFGVLVRASPELATLGVLL